MLLRLPLHVTLVALHLMRQVHRVLALLLLVVVLLPVLLMQPVQPSRAWQAGVQCSRAG
jgi:hypothetical protein